ncbi:MAG TPA: UbiH/UbiF/VisC/COQ6 family ubiquinone biosynthesis hydroxylase [Azospirillaceae bacterium]|nr:UbiH/UbiF/VisC/COQ6 family ubiquinone biosynthesis hydroxylase [Azospirillaceae bacterium]
MTHVLPEPARLNAEVLIVGGGLAGLTLAAALGTAGVPTVLVDRETRDDRMADTFDGRTTAVALGSKRAMEGAGIWPLLPDHVDQGAIRDIRVADDNAPLFLHYDHREVGDQPFGWVVENGLLRRAGFARLDALAAVTHLAPAAVAGMERDGGRIVARLSDGRTVAARLVVGADGRHSFCRNWAGIRTFGWDYPQTAIVCNVAHEFPHHGVAVEHFLPSGPFAVLPLSGDRSSIVWTERRELAPSYMKLDEDRFARELRRRAGDWLGEMRPIGPRFAYPLHLFMAERYTDDRLALVGEAAHAIHPIAGQGLNMGLRDVAALAEVVVDTYRLGLDVGGPDVLARFQRWRRSDNLLLAVVTDGLNRLFSNRIGPVRLARDVGLSLVGKVPPLKRLLMRHAMGTVGRLPRLVAGDPL